MDERHLKSFIVVSEHLHFRRAAESLHMSQAALSHTIRQLEDEVGTELLVRTTRRVQLTQAGRTFYEYAQRAIQSIQRGKMLALKSARGQNTIAIGMTSAASHGCLSELICSFSVANPTIEWQFHEIPANAPIDQLKTGIIDLAAFYGFCSDPYLSGLSVQTESCMMAIPARNPLARSKAELSLDKLGGEKLLVPAQRTSFGLYENLIAACSEEAEPPVILPQAGGAHMLLGLVAANIGILCVPRSLAIPHKGVAYRRIRGRCVDITFRLYWRKSELPSVAQRFIETVKARSVGKKQSVAKTPSTERHQ
jgi:DNA-binding transcriptional LysR family regulator